MNHFTQKSYDETALAYTKKVANLHPKTWGEKFLKMLPPTGTILDVGCGSGRDANIFSEKGFNVIGIDFSEKMIEIAKKTAPKATFYVEDIESLHFQEKSFDGIWASASLLHLPKKQLPDALLRIHKLLKKGGAFFLSMKMGIGETIEKDARYGGVEKFWSFFTEQEMATLLSDAGFTEVEICFEKKKPTYDTHSILNIFSRSAGFGE